MNDYRNVLIEGTILAGRYIISEKIGSGGFAITYKARDQKNCIDVAIKEFYPMDDSLDKVHEKERFLREARVLKEYDYLEGIVSVRDVFEEMDTAFLVMDFIEGITLKDYVKQYGTFSWEELLDIFMPIMKSLTKLHRSGITHCDISPDNLMIDMDNKLRLIDFGATQHSNTRSERTIIVKQGYAPLEQYYYDGSVADGLIGPWTDVYALAATMYMALTGDKPRTSVERLNESDADFEFKSLLKVIKPSQAESLIKGMAVYKSSRYATMDKFLEALKFSDDADDKMSVTRIVKKSEEAGLIDASDKEKKAKDATLILLFSSFVVLALLLGFIIRGFLKDNSEDTLSDKANGVNKEAVTEITEVSKESVTEVTTKAVTEDGIEAVREKLEEDTTETATENKTEVETEEATKAATESETEAETEVATEAVTEAKTEAETEVATETVTETKTETEVTTEATTEAVTEAETQEDASKKNDNVKKEKKSSNDSDNDDSSDDILDDSDDLY